VQLRHRNSVIADIIECDKQIATSKQNSALHCCSTTVQLEGNSFTCAMFLVASQLYSTVRL